MTTLTTDWALAGAVPRRRTIRPARAVCRLTMLINGTDYRIDPTPAEPPAAVKAYRLSKADGTAYDIAQHLGPAARTGQRAGRAVLAPLLGEMPGGREGGAGTLDPGPRPRGATVYHTCDCPDFIFHRDGVDPDGCKHIKALVAYGLLDPTE
jgi:hypothetical protein